MVHCPFKSQPATWGRRDHAARVGDAPDAGARVVAAHAPIDCWRLDTAHPQDMVPTQALARMGRG